MSQSVEKISTDTINSLTQKKKNNNSKEELPSNPYRGAEDYLNKSRKSHNSDLKDVARESFFNKIGS